MKPKKKEAIRPSASSAPAAACACSSKLEDAIVAELNKEEDSVSLFLLSLAPGLRAMSKNKFRQFQIRVLNSIAQLEDETGEKEELVQRTESNSSFKEEVKSSTEKESAAPILSLHLLDKVRAALNLESTQSVLSAFGITLHGADMHTLREFGLLNDKIINVYFGLIEERSTEIGYRTVYAFDTYFFPKLKEGGHASVATWGVKEQALSHDIVLVPVHQEEAQHWSLAIVDMDETSITYYDSMGWKNHNCLDVLEQFLIQNTDKLSSAVSDE